MYVVDEVRKWTYLLYKKGLMRAERQLKKGRTSIKSSKLNCFIRTSV